MRTKDRALMITRMGALRVSLSALFGAAVALGCGGGDSDGGDVSTGIAPSKLLADVTPSEAAQACERLEAGFSAVVSEDVIIRTVCTLFGAASEDTPAACVTQRDTCIQQANQAGSETMMGVSMVSTDFECGDGASLTACTATVGQLETCFNDTLDLVSAALGQVSCDDAASITMDDVDSFGEDTFGTAPSSCENLDCGEDSPFGEE